MKLTNQVIQATQQCLMRSSLTPDQVTNLIHRCFNVRSDYAMWYVDWKLLDSFKEIWMKAGWNDEVEQLRLSAKDVTLTKRFYNFNKTVENLDHYLDDSLERPDFSWNVNYRVAITLLERMMKVERLEVAPLNTVQDAYKLWSNKSASAGAIGQGSKEDNDIDCFNAALLIEKKIRDGIPFSEIWIPNVMFHRSQITKYVGKEDTFSTKHERKDRFIWGSDGGTVTFEGKYAHPLIQHLITRWYNYSGGDSSFVLRSKIASCFEKNRKWFSLDFSKFDQSIQSWMIKDCFSIIKKFFDCKYHKEIDWICYNFINTWILIPGKGVIQKHRGIPSGSHFTSVIGSMAQALIDLTFLSSRCQDGSFDEKLSYVENQLSVARCGVGNHELTAFFMGDDGLLFTRDAVDADCMSKYVWRVFGMKIHPDKTDSYLNSKYPKYLKREWKGIGEYRPPVEMAVNMIHPENERTYDCYSPWHILYGVFLTYGLSFPSYVTERYFIQKMQSNGGIAQLLSLEPKQLPGSLRMLGYDVRYQLYNRAKAFLSTA